MSRSRSLTITGGSSAGIRNRSASPGMHPTLRLQGVVPLEDLPGCPVSFRRDSDRFRYPALARDPSRLVTAAGSGTGPAKES